MGGDFVRKGGDILLKVAPGLSDRYEFDVVTRDPVEAPSCIRLHKAEPNSEVLRSLYARADIFVMPTRAECFGIAVIEAMASGLPCIVGDVGGVCEITRPGETGWLIEPSVEGLRSALIDAYRRKLELTQMGRAARADAEVRFDGRRNDKLALDLVLQQIELARSRSSEKPPLI